MTRCRLRFRLSGYKRYWCASSSIRGLVLSDDMEMGGILSQKSIEEAAVSAVLAGTHLIEICKEPALILRAYEALLTEAEGSPAFRRILRGRGAQGSEDARQESCHGSRAKDRLKNRSMRCGARLPHSAPRLRSRHETAIGSTAEGTCSDDRCGNDERHIGGRNRRGIRAHFAEAEGCRCSGPSIEAAARTHRFPSRRRYAALCSPRWTRSRPRRRNWLG